MRRTGILTLACAGCLSTPPEAPRDGGDIDAATIDAPPGDVCVRDPRPATACDAVGDFTGAAYAPGGGFVFRQAVVDDVNADGQDDLLIVENTVGAETIHVLLGPIDPDAPMTHATIDTNLEVGEVEVRELGGPSPCPELTLFGRLPGGGGQVQVWDYEGGGGAMYPGPPLTAGTDLEPEVGSGPTMLAWARLHDDTDDLLIADLDQLAIIHVDGNLDDLESRPEVSVMHLLSPPMALWENINGLEPGPTMDCSRDRVLVAENLHAHFLTDGGDGTGTFEGGVPSWSIPGGNPVTLSTHRIDLDGVAPDDVLIGGTQEHGAYLLAHDGADGVAVTVVAGDTGYSPAGFNNWVDGVAVGDLGGGPAPEWVGVDHDPTGPEARAILIDGLSVNGTALEGDAPQPFIDFPVDYEPRGVVIADLLGAGTSQAWVFSTDGRLRCLRRLATGAALELCP